MKKIVGAMLTAAVMAFSSVVCSAAKEEKASSAADASATFCFDTNVGVSRWEVFGSAESAGLTMDISNERKVSGSALVISEDFTEALSSKFGGIKVSSKSFGLSSFEG